MMLCGLTEYGSGLAGQTGTTFFLLAQDSYKMYHMRMKRIQVFLSSQILATLHTIQRETGQSLSEIVRQAVMFWLQHRQ
jgi:hypothetical protein